MSRALVIALTSTSAGRRRGLVRPDAKSSTVGYGQGPVRGLGRIVRVRLH